MNRKNLKILTGLFASAAVGLFLWAVFYDHMTGGDYIDPTTGERTFPWNPTYFFAIGAGVLAFILAIVLFITAPRK